MSPHELNAQDTRVAALRYDTGFTGACLGPIGGGCTGNRTKRNGTARSAVRLPKSLGFISHCCDDVRMRISLDIDDDILQAARILAAVEGKNIGKVLSNLARRGLDPRNWLQIESRFPVFDVDQDSPQITLQTVKDALDVD
jgi:hypothetical protein